MTSSVGRSAGDAGGAISSDDELPADESALPLLPFVDVSGRGGRGDDPPAAGPADAAGPAAALPPPGRTKRARFASRSAVSCAIRLMSRIPWSLNGTACSTRI